ncbi:hypothetical protein [uncultured Christiangramia sp.]|uniref:HD domain-containing protein n=1 Tax=uncultured Christiangramia sp. TaxID=503836 RepID=UPI0026223A4F|nr:hypothetical protein [uncultured Christiangramia sp.]
MNWIDTSYEIAMKDYFIKELGETNGLNLYSKYEVLRNAMIEDNFFNEIKGAEPDLSDHSQKHIQDVFSRAYKVIGKEEFKKFNIYEIYCLAIMILFHDVGNIRGRDNHYLQARISEVYNNYRANIQRFRDERRIISRGASAHSGKTNDGSLDTLKQISTDNLGGESINLIELAAILRFADELAEGRQRTCSFLIENNLLDPGSLIFHKYAEITTIHIDRNLERISITYDINIKHPFTRDEQKEIKELILFTFNRAVKLDIERRYTKNYSDVLKAFKFVSVSYNFSKNEIPFEVNLKNILFEDQYPIPGEAFKKGKVYAEELITSKDKDYILSNLMESIKNKIK